METNKPNLKSYHFLVTVESTKEVDEYSVIGALTGNPHFDEGDKEYVTVEAKTDVL